MHGQNHFKFIRVVFGEVYKSLNSSFCIS